MSGKFMTTKKIVISAITLMLIASQLTGCACGSSSEFLNMYERQQEIVIEIAEPISQEQGTERTYEWEELAYLNTYPEFRDTFDDAIGVTLQGQNGKNGVVYVDPSTRTHTNNSTLRYAFANQKFLDKCWNNTETMKVLIESVKNNFVDVESDSVARVAVLNTYFNILPDAEPNYFNGNQTLTRGEFLAALYRAETPVTELSENMQFKNLVDPSGSDETTVFANQMLNYSYLTTADESLNASTYAGKITRAEVIYTLVQRYYSDEFNSVTGKETAYGDTKNGGDIASDEGFNKSDKKYGKAYELSYAINHERAGLPVNLYKAMVVAKRHSLLTGTQSRWDEALTKAEFIDLIARVYEDLGTSYSADRGASKGEVVDNTNPNDSKEDMSYPGFEPSQITNNNGQINVSDEMIESVSLLPGYEDITKEQIKTLIEQVIVPVITDDTTAEQIHTQLSLLIYSDFIRGEILGILPDINIEDMPEVPDDVVTAPTPAPTPVVEKFTFTEEEGEPKNRRNNISMLVWAEPHDESELQGELGAHSHVVILATCNETGFIKISYGKEPHLEQHIGYVDGIYRSELLTPIELKESLQSGKKTTPTPSTQPIVTQSPSSGNNVTPTPTSKPKPTQTPSSKYNAPEPSKPLSNSAEETRQQIIQKMANFDENAAKLIPLIVDYRVDGTPVMPGGYTISDNGRGLVNKYGNVILGLQIVDGFTEDGKPIVFGQVMEEDQVEMGDVSDLEHTGSLDFTVH